MGLPSVIHPSSKGANLEAICLQPKWYYSPQEEELSKVKTGFNGFESCEEIDNPTFIIDNAPAHLRLE